MQFFGQTERSTFLSRPNRFTLLCKLRKRVVRAFLPNPGRLWELLLPGALVYLEPAQKRERILPYTAVAVQRETYPVVLHTHKANTIARSLIESGRVPGLEGAQVVQEEVSTGRSRFDFLLRGRGGHIYLEVKSCTLFSKKAALFPDAVTARGKRHVEELARMRGKGIQGAVLLLVHSPDVGIFAPEYHTDLEFARALCRAKVRVIPLSLGWGEDLTLQEKTKVLPVPWEIVEREGRERGSYLLLLRVPRPRTLEVGRLGRLSFRSGFYIYVGSARRNLFQRIRRHRRLAKKKFWHIDFLREAAEFFAALPILTEDAVECALARAVKGFAEREVPRFGSSDCSCSSHLFWTSGNPLQSLRFHALLQYFRVDRLIGDPEPGELPAASG